MIALDLVMATDAPSNVTFELFTANTNTQHPSTQTQLAALKTDNLETIIMVDHLKGRTTFRNRLIMKGIVITGIILSAIVYYVRST